MGKAAAAAPPATAMDDKPRKKKGRPPKNTPPSTRRSTRRNPSGFNSPPQFDDDDDERKQKKVKLVVRLPESKKFNRRTQQSDSGSGSGSESEDRGVSAKKRKINGGSDDAVSAQEEEEEEEEMKGTESPAPGSQLESGPTTPLPDKSLLVFILERLQKKDTYGVFSEAVDPDELPDYFEIIDQPMDFGTVRKKLDNRAYKTVEELEADIFLICSNAMQYNAPDTIYYRQARSIQELAKRDFQNLKNEGEDGEPQPKVVRRGRPPGVKTMKKSLETSSPNDNAVSGVVPELSSGATLASEEEKAAGSNSYNLRKAPMQSRFRSSDPFASSYSSRNGENHYDWSANWHNEFPAHILRADLKYGNKHFTVDESRRHSYKQPSHPSSGSGNYPMPSDLIGMKRLVMVGLQEPLAYARSLARYAATLGPVAWKIAANKIQAGIPPGMQFGPGWVGDNGPPSRQLSFSNEKQKSPNNFPSHSNSAQILTPSTSDPSQNEQKPVFQPHLNCSSGIQSPPEHKTVFQPHANSAGGMVVKPSIVQQQNENSTGGMVTKPSVIQQQNANSAGGMVTKPSVIQQQNANSAGGMVFKPSVIPQQNANIAGGMVIKPSVVPQQNANIAGGILTKPTAIQQQNANSAGVMVAKPTLMQQQQQKYSLSDPPDLNVRVLVGSPPSSSSLQQIGSPQQPDLALQL